MSELARALPLSLASIAGVTSPLATRCIMARNFLSYKGYALEEIDGYMHICHWFGCEDPLICANLQDAKNQIDKKLKKEKMNSSLTIEDVMKAKKALQMNYANQQVVDVQWYGDTISYTNPIQLAPLNVSPYPQDCCKPASVPCQKGNNPMYVDNDKHIESSKINYLTSRLEMIYYKKDGEARKLFGLVNDTAPESAEELVKRIQDGKYTLSDETKKKVNYDPVRYITWRDPAVKQDADGFKAAMKAYELLAQDARDTIAIGTPAEGLAAVKALDAWTPTVGTA